MNKLSAVIITFNEERNIARCLESVKNIADEIIVVDSFSTDNTRKICHEYNARFIENKFEGHIQQKNFAASMAQFDYVLSLDADELLSNELNNSILKAKSNNLPADGYMFNRLNNYCGQWIKHSGWYPDKKLRLWNRHKGNWGGENPHDKYIMAKDAKIEHLKGDILHFTFHSIEQHIDTINKFSTIAAYDRFKKGKKTNIIKLLCKPIVKFFTLYLVRFGFLDGYYGFVIAANSAFSSYLKEIKLKNIHKK